MMLDCVCGTPPFFLDIRDVLVLLIRYKQTSAIGGKLKDAARLAVQEEKENNANNNYKSDKGSSRVNGASARRPSLALDQAAKSLVPGRAADVPWTEYLGVRD
jgi:hypothetical protein